MESSIGRKTQSSAETSNLPSEENRNNRGGTIAPKDKQVSKGECLEDGGSNCLSHA